jgi:hypothetical protein
MGKNLDELRKQGETSGGGTEEVSCGAAGVGAALLKIGSFVVSRRSSDETLRS